MNRIGYLDGWRGLAIIAVIIGHFITERGINLGRFGVELFFVLSGRLMAEILFVRGTPLSSFFPRRFSRVYPALFVFAAVIFAVACLVHAADPTIAQYLAVITFTANYADFWTDRSLAFDHIWSLCVEEHLYILLGLLALVHRRRRLPVAPICLALAVAAMIDGWVQTRQGLDYYQVYWRTDVRGASILLGAAAYLAFHERAPGPLSSRWAPLLLGGLSVLLNFDVMPDPVKYSIGSACLALSIVLLPRAPSGALRSLENPLLLRAGMFSYSLYLWQQPFYAMGGNLGHRLVHLALAMVPTVLSFYLVEQPARRYLNQRLHARAARVVG